MDKTLSGFCYDFVCTGAIYENGTFWNCWSWDFIALCTKGPDFQESELRRFPLAVGMAAFHRKRKKDQSCIF
uniref:Uncharacterized protein n=1 Tax=Ursus americanus TaxID=9643 RepID=A0A452S7R2_URSAM